MSAEIWIAISTSPISFVFFLNKEEDSLLEIGVLINIKVFT
jgi:hypothetical protein